MLYFGITHGVMCEQGT